MSNANPYSFPDTKQSESLSEFTPTRLPVRHFCLYVPAFVIGCIVGTEIAWNANLSLSGGTVLAELLLLQQPLAIFTRNMMERFT